MRAVLWCYALVQGASCAAIDRMATTPADPAHPAGPSMLESSAQAASGLLGVVTGNPLATLVVGGALIASAKAYSDSKK